jgi:hypothetical protein
VSKLSDFQEALRTVEPGHQANLNYEGCVWLNSEIDRLQNVAKQALLDQRAAEAENKEFKRIQELQRRFDKAGADRELDEEK